MKWRRIFRRALALAACLALCLAPVGAADPSPAPTGGALVEDTLGVELPIVGSMKAGANIMTVTLPVEIPFVVQVDQTGAYLGLLAASGAVVKNSSATAAVELTVVGITDNGNYLDKLELTLTGEQAVPLAAGMAEAPLGRAEAGGELPLRLSGGARAGGSLGADGEVFTLGLTLKAVQVKK